MSGLSGSTSTTNVSQHPDSTFAAPRPPCAGGAVAGGDSADSVIIFDVKDIDDNERAQLTSQLTRIEAKRKVVADFKQKRDDFMARKRACEATLSQADQDFNTKADQVVSIQKFECIQSLPADKRATIANMCKDMATQALDSFTQQAGSLLEGTAIQHNAISAGELRKLGIITLQLAVEREVSMESSRQEMEQIDAELNDLQVAHDAEIERLNARLPKTNVSGLQRQNTEARAERRAKEIAEEHLRKSMELMRSMGISEDQLRTLFPQLFTDELAADVHAAACDKTQQENVS